MKPNCEYETAIIQCFFLSIKSGFNHFDCEYAIVRDFSKKYALDSIELYQVIKSMIGELNRGRK